MNRSDDLKIVDTLREALLEIGFRRGTLRYSIIERLPPIRFDVVKRTKFGRFLILGLADRRAGAQFYQFAVEHPWLLRFLSERLGKPIRIIGEYNGRVKLIITLVPPNESLEKQSNVLAFGYRTAVIRQTALPI